MVRSLYQYFRPGSHCYSIMHYRTPTNPEVLGVETHSLRLHDFIEKLKQKLPTHSRTDIISLATPFASLYHFVALASHHFHSLRFAQGIQEKEDIFFVKSIFSWTKVSYWSSTGFGDWLTSTQHNFVPFVTFWEHSGHTEAQHFQFCGRPADACRPCSPRCVSGARSLARIPGASEVLNGVG